MPQLPSSSGKQPDQEKAYEQLVDKITERVWKLLQEDLRYSQERRSTGGKR